MSGPEIESRGSKRLMKANPLPKLGVEVARFDDPVVGAAPGANLRHARREAAVLRGERIRQHLDRFDRTARQFEIEIARRRIVEARAADLESAGRRAAALDAQPAIRAANDAGQHRQERLKVVAGERLHVHPRAIKTSLTATGCRLSVGELAGTRTWHALADERQFHFDEHLFGAPAWTVNGDDSVSEKPSRTRQHDVAARRDGGKIHLAKASLVVCAITMLPATSRRSTFTEGMRSPSITIVTTTRPSPVTGGGGSLRLEQETGEQSDRQPGQVSSAASRAESRDDSSGRTSPLPRVPTM